MQKVSETALPRNDTDHASSASYASSFVKMPIKHESTSGWSLFTKQWCHDSINAIGIRGWADCWSWWESNRYQPIVDNDILPETSDGFQNHAASSIKLAGVLPDENRLISLT
jgi:hypothetical protein